MAMRNFESMRTKNKNQLSLRLWDFPTKDHITISVKNAADYLPSGGD